MPVSATHDTSGAVPLVPRLRYSGELLDGITMSLLNRLRSLESSNGRLAGLPVAGRGCPESVRTEAAVIFALEALSHVRARAGRIAGMSSIPAVLPASVQVARAVSASLYVHVPGCSQRLSELSVHLGSIVLDSAAITRARFDFERSNSEATAVLDQAKLIAESKIRTRYPKLGFRAPWVG